ncbi:hypothetical protein ACEZCY_04080 [Streptacidiphilus sp. N1-12]|uniref:Uncharacterized protein n=2 Tax=Streptacidiphilus alkalitolerans TaxID=3342712 RepID=A0ABV6V483_9ACTN
MEDAIADVLTASICAAGLVAMAISLRNGARRRRAALAAQWEHLVRMRADPRSRGAELVRVVRVYQRAARGSKALVAWATGGAQQDAWFWFWAVPVGAHVLVRSTIGYGPHNRNPSVLYVRQEDVLAWAPAGAMTAWQAASGKGRWRRGGAART